MSSAALRNVSRAMLSAALLTGAAHAQSVQDHPVRAVFMQGIGEFNAHHLETFLEQFAPDLEMYAADAGWLRTPASVRERYVSTFARFPNVRMEIDSLRVRPTGREAAVVNFIFRVYPSGTGAAFEGTGSGTYALRDGRWVEVQEHETVTRVDPLLRR